MGKYVDLYFMVILSNTHLKTFKVFLKHLKHFKTFYQIRNMSHPIFLQSPGFCIPGRITLYYSEDFWEFDGIQKTRKNEHEIMES